MDTSPVAAAAAFLGDPVHDAIVARGAAAVENSTAAYLEAVGKCPEVIRQESPHAMFLAFCNHNVSLAASRLATFWRVRKEVFGPIEAFMPTVHALTEEEKAKLAQGSGVFLQPKKECDRLVFFWDRSRMAQKWSGKSMFKAFYFVMHSLSLELYHRSSGENFDAIHVTLLQPQAGATSVNHLHPLTTPTSKNTEDLRTRIFRDSLCLCFQEMHAVAIVEEKASKRVFLETVVPVTMETIRELFSVPGSVKLHCKATKAEVLQSLEADGFCAKNLPASVGGTWSYETEWRPWLRKIGILPAPILLPNGPPSAVMIPSLRQSAPPSQGGVREHGADVSAAVPLEPPSVESNAELSKTTQSSRGGSSPFAREHAVMKRPPPPPFDNPLTTIAPRPIPMGPPQGAASNPSAGPHAPLAAEIFASAPRPAPKGTRPTTGGISPSAIASKPVPKRLPPFAAGASPFTAAPPIPKGPPLRHQGSFTPSDPRPIAKGPLSAFAGRPFAAQQPIPREGPLLAGLARIMRQPPARALVTPGSTPEPTSVLQPPPPPVCGGKPVGLAGLGLLRSLSPAPAKKVVPPEQSHPIHDAMASLPASVTVAYKEAMNRCPQIVKADSPFEQYLAFCQGNPNFAARRLATYWTWRRQIFGETDAFLPLSQALTMYDVALLVRGDLGAIIATGQKKKPILYLHGAGDVKQARLNAPAGSNPKLRVMWYLLQSIADLAGRTEGLSGFAEAICICELTPLTLAIFTDDVAESISNVIRDAMCVRFELHVAVPGVTPASGGALGQAIPVALEFLGEMVNCKPSCNSGPNSITVHQSADIDQVRTSLEAQISIPGDLLPSSCGGIWGLESDWRAWLQDHSTLRGPLALVLMMMKPTKPPPGKRKVEAADHVPRLQQHGFRKN